MRPAPAGRAGALAALGLLAAAASPAQQTSSATEELAFDRPESWAMKYVTSVSLPTGFSLPERLGAGGIRLGLEGAYVPQVSDDQRRVGFDGTKLEDINKTKVFGRIRAQVGLSKSYSAELGYVPPIRSNGAKPHLVSLAFARPFDLSPAWRLGLRAFGQIGTIHGDITCSAEEAAAGPDPDANPFSCEAPSDDTLDQSVLGLEVTAGYVKGAWRPYLGLSLNHLDLEFQVNARYAGLLDHTRQLTDGTTVSLTAGVSYEGWSRWRLGALIFYSPLSVTRPPATSASTEGLWSVRALVSYRLR